jgi:ubiquitin carboxyl-terminal hydrolase 5/13
MEKLSKHILMQDVPISTPLELDLESYRGHGLQEGEVEFPADQVVTNEPFFDEDSLNALLGMGFPENRCKRALIKTGNNGADIAMNWLFEHMDDPGFLFIT